MGFQKSQQIVLMPCLHKISCYQHEKVICWEIEVVNAKAKEVRNSLVNVEKRCIRRPLNFVTMLVTNENL
jgi:hypothetical protein